MESQEIIMSTLLARILVEEDLFFSVDEEATSVAECIVCLSDGDDNDDIDADDGIDDEGDGNYNMNNDNKRISRSHCKDTELVSNNRVVIRDRLIEYIEMDEKDADRIIDLLIKRLRRYGGGGGDSSSSSDDDRESTHGSSSSHDDDDEEEEDVDSTSGPIIVDGQCELCERCNVKLTKHHLIPKSTWSKIEIKIMRSTEALIDDKDSEKAKMIVGDGLIDLLDEVQSSFMKNPNKADRKMAVRTVLRRRTTDICRACHSAVHTTHDNMSLAVTFNSVEKLLNDTKIYNFCKWQSKQRPGRYAKPAG
mmetsp:Transcript_2470/g.5397  ORF Transcript_2470/g.5397 Transcript_2470/m.5397 type:complete len:307 (-) Transcript_2470:147-1067(-)